VTATGVSSQLVGTNGPFIRHDFTFRNGCESRMLVSITFGSGGTGARLIDAKQTATWFCTQGFPNQTDCTGGAINFSWKPN
jgi:hypothetical protein